MKKKATKSKKQEWIAVDENYDTSGPFESLELLLEYMEENQGDGSEFSAVEISNCKKYQVIHRSSCEEIS